MKKLKEIIDQYLKSDVIILHNEDKIIDFAEITDNIFDTLKENEIEFTTEVDRKISDYLEKYISDLGYPYLFISKEVNDLRKENKNLKNKLKKFNMKKIKGTICMSWGEYGGFYFYNGYTIRLCLGWIAFTYIPEEIDKLI